MWAAFLDKLMALVVKISQAWALITLGHQREREKQLKEQADVAKKQADIAASPDLDRNDLYKRMRDRASGGDK